ncbi:recombinase family protein [Paenibacillus thermotolerans]|uniref:recombinase family protein n=1 Tax=Paenibacillus thermotolerans TaxID=3027807 RepID=UPI002368F27C|nr:MULTISPECIES: recombinase family protein [unclassified Paenibacillus]
MDQVAIYLRKSRADEEAERRGEGETLAKHKKALLKTAKNFNLNIVKIYEEIVSGEFIDFRPEMQQLLKAVENNEYDAVLVMDVDRFGRGNMQEQGMILDAFRKSKTKIITPRKVYDLTDEFDEEYSEFEAFMARKELKIINRRLQGGRIRSVEDGNYLGTRPPYGYMIKYDDRGGRLLVPHPEQAPIVQMIFEWYTDPVNGMGSSKIASELNKLKLPSYTGIAWKPASIITMLKNIVYIGKIAWKKKEQKKSKVPGKKRETRTRNVEEWVIADGKHDPLVDKHIFEIAQEKLKEKYHSPFQLDEKGKPKIATALAGLIKCSMCGSTMVYRPYTNAPAHLRCNTPSCQNKSSRYEYVEKKLILSLETWLSDYKVKWNQPTTNSGNENKIMFIKKSIAFLEKELSEFQQQKNKLHDFLERGIYDEQTFLERSQNIAERTNEIIRTVEQKKKELQEEELRSQATEKLIPLVESVLEAYKLIGAGDEVKKNYLLKSILHYAVYRKERHQRDDQFTLVLRPKKRV